MMTFKKHFLNFLILALFNWILTGIAFAGFQEDITRGYSYIDQWQFSKAQSYVKTLNKTYPNSGDVIFFEARVEFYKGNYQKAWELLKDVEDTQSIVKTFKTLVKNTLDATQGFVSHESDHFIFHYSDGPDEVLIPFAEEVLEKSYQVLGKILNFYPKDKVLIEIYPDREPFSRISPLTLKDIMTSGTVALCKYNRIMMISPGSLVRGYNWLDTLSHEYVHYLLSSKSNNNAPLWLHEGMAKFLEARWRNGENHLSPIMETVLADALTNDYMVELEAMMPSFAKLKSAEDVQLAYAEVATMIDYMVHTNGENILASLADALSQNKLVEKVLEELLGNSLSKFQTQWKDYIKKQPLKKIPGLTVLKFQFKKNQSQFGETSESKTDITSVSRQAQDFTLLGDILKSRQFVEAAIIEYEKAIENSQTLSPVLYNKLAITYLSNNQDKEAEKLLQESLKYYPMFHTTLSNLGEVYFFRKNFSKSEFYFKQAEKINPFNPLVHARLINIYTKLAKTSKKEEQVRLFSLIK